MKAVKIIKGVALVGALLAMGSMVLASGGGPGVSAEEALQKLLDGNKRFVENKMNACGPASSTSAREGLAKGQKPYAIILSCSDSRLPPEVIFDKGLGEIFVVRVAGNIPDPIVLGSIEYAAEHLGSPLVMVLGHERCGAVTATVDAKGKPEGNIGAIVKKIQPAAKQAKKQAAGKSKPEVVEAATDINTKMVAASLTKDSPVLKHLVKEGKIKIVTAKYDLDDGVVSIMK